MVASAKRPLTVPVVQDELGAAFLVAMVSADLPRSRSKPPYASNKPAEAAGGRLERGLAVEELADAETTVRYS